MDRLYSLLIILYEDDPEELNFIENRYREAREKIGIVFRDVSYTCYPLLLKLCGSRFHYYSDFLKYRKGLIMSFLRLEKEDLIELPDPLQETLKLQFSQAHLKKILDEKKQENQRKFEDLK